MLAGINNTTVIRFASPALTDVDNVISFTQSITADSKWCYFDKAHFPAGYDDIDVNLPRFIPEDSDEDMNASGRHMSSIELSEETAAYTLDVTAFAKGLYVVRLVSGSQASTGKFVVV